MNGYLKRNNSGAYISYQLELKALQEQKDNYAEYLSSNASVDASYLYPNNNWIINKHCFIGIVNQVLDSSITMDISYCLN